MLVMATGATSENTPSYDKAWTIHAAIIGLNTGNILFQGLELDPDNPDMIVVIGLTILCAALPFQAIFFLINSYIQEFDGMHELEYAMLERLLIICQVISFSSLIGIAILMSNTHHYMGIAFIVSAALAILFLRTASNQADTLSRMPR
jgi:O-antigen/teichoic acid export membrane protein